MSAVAKAIICHSIFEGPSGNRPGSLQIRRNIFESSGGMLMLIGHSMARDDMNKSKKVLTSTTTASKYIPKRPRIAQQEESLISFSSGFKSLRMHIQGCQGCQMTRNVLRNSKILIAKSTIQPKLSKTKNNLPFFKEL